MTPEERRATFALFIQAVEDGQSVREAAQAASTHWRTLSTWMSDPTVTTDTGEPFHARYARARVHSAEGFAERALQVALDAEDAQLGRLQVDTLKWRAAMADPKRYGERRQVDTTHTVRLLPPDERDKALGRIIARANLIPDNGIPLLASPSTGEDEPPEAA